MRKTKLSLLTRLLMVLAALSWGADQGGAASKNKDPMPTMTPQQMMEKKVTPAQRKAAAANQKAKRDAAAAADQKAIQGAAAAAGIAPLAYTGPGLVPDPTTGALVPDYFGTTPNWAFSPPLRKFVDSLGNSIPLPDLKALIAKPDTLTYPGSDYYEIEVAEFDPNGLNATDAWGFHPDLPKTKLRMYRQTNNGTACDTATPPSCTNSAPPPPAAYLGPVIVATKDRPTRIKFTNSLPTTALGGDLFIPTDTTVMGAGSGYDPITNTTGTYPQNRGTLHLHGGFTPWISDGTPHQWVTPTGEAGPLTTGVSTQPVPDMDLPSGNSMYFYWPNQQSGRLMFYHDHAYGITRLNVYAGEAAGFLVRDAGDTFLESIASFPGLASNYFLVIQDKTFVWGTRDTLLACGQPDLTATGTFETDPTWCDPIRKWGQEPGSLWLPHVYMTNQNPWDMTGANGVGRWDYAFWFWPPYTGIIANGTKPNPYAALPGEPPEIPGTPNPSLVPEAFMDTPVVNGKAYPTLSVPAGPVRLRILNAANDRFQNLSLFVAADNTTQTTATPVPGLPTTTPVNLCNGTSLLSAGDPRCTEVKMVPFNSSQNLVTPFPDWWYTPGLNFTFDDRMGGVPDPNTRGPAMIQIGTEGGLLPAPAVVVNQPVNYTYNRKDIVVLSVQEHALFLGPAERADVIVDFTNFAGNTLILYNDAPAPLPAGDQRVDYYTGNPDFSVATGDGTGGAPTTPPGYGPNTRTIMRIVVDGVTPAIGPVDDVNASLLTALQDTTAGLPAAFRLYSDPIIVPQSAYNAAYGTTVTDVPGVNAARISSTSLTFSPLAPCPAPPAACPLGGPMTFNLRPKAIQELFELDYGRMNATLGVELPFTNAGNQTTLPFGYIDPPTEFIDSSATIVAPVAGDGTQIWKITHNGVDTHAIHVHLFNVQVVNRVGWDGAIRLPDANELGWKETVRMNPLEDIIVALRPTTPKLPFGLPDSVRLMDVTSPPGTSGQFAPFDPFGNPVTTVNSLVNFGWEYVWHCHLLGHEENDMMRPTVFNTLRSLPAAPAPLTLLQGVGQVTLNWADTTPFNYVTGQPATTLGNPANEIGFRIARALNGGAFTTVGLALANATTFVDAYTPPLNNLTTYRVFAYNAAGDSLPAEASIGTLPVPPAAPTGLTARVTGMNPPAVGLSWVDNATNEVGFTIQRATNATFTTNLISFTAPADATTYSDTTVVRGTRYYYRVRAFNQAVPVGTSAWSNVVNLLVQISFVRVRAATPQTPTAVVNLAYQAAQAAGNLNVVAVGWNDAVSSVQSVTDNRGNVYNLAVGPTTGTGLRQSIYYASNIVGGATTVTVTFNQPAAFVDVRILEYSGVNTLDVTRAAFGTGTALNSGPATTTAANELVFGAAMVSQWISAPGAGFTTRIITTPDADLAEDRIATAIGTFSATATGGASGNWVMQMATFK